MKIKTEDGQHKITLERADTTAADRLAGMLDEVAFKLDQPAAKAAADQLREFVAAPTVAYADDTG